MEHFLDCNSIISTTTQNFGGTTSDSVIEYTSEIIKVEPVIISGDPLECNSEVYNTDANLLISGIEESPFQCIICSIRFMRASELIAHARKKHPKGKSCVSISNPNNKQSQAAASKSVNRLNADPSLQPVTQAIVSSQVVRHKRERTQEYVCSVCAVEFQYAFQLTVHMRKHTDKIQQLQKPKIQVLEHENEKGIIQNLTQSEQSQEHIIIHAGENVFACPYCNKLFSAGAQLEQHLKSHTSEELYTCNICDKKFLHSSSLYEHLEKDNVEKHAKLRNGENSYVCNICHASFMQMWFLNIHLKNHTPEMPYACSLCNEAFGNTGQLSNHLRSHKKKKKF